MTTSALPVLAVTGLRAEARIAGGPGVATLSGGGDAARLAVLLQESLAAGAKAVISFGIAGGLAAGLPAGTVVVADAVEDGDERWATDGPWQRSLVRALPYARRGRLFGSHVAVEHRSGKTALHERTGALAVDMESHIAARLASQYGVPFACLRVIADPAERALPKAALVGMRSDGSTDIGAVLRALAAEPRETLGLIRTALDARAAFLALKSSRRLMSAQFGFAESARGVTAREPRVEAAPVRALQGHLTPELTLIEGSAETG